MSRFKKIFAATIMGLVLIPCVFADDIALLTIGNKSEAQSATTILGHAYGKVGDRFIVKVNEDQLQQLASANIDCEVVFTDATIENLRMVLSPDSHRRMAGVRIERMGRTVRLDDGRHLVEMNRTAASVLSNTTGYTSIPMEELSVGFHFRPPVVAAPVLKLTEYPTDTLASLVSQDSVYSFNKRLEDFYTRYIWTDSIDRARDWMVQKFHAWGYTDVTTPSFSYGGGTHYNVKAIKPGFAEPEKVIVVGGHYDAITYGQAQPPTVYAPGADDDGSGTALTLELARILADVPLRKTVVFVPFSAEEVGLVGSRAAAQDFRADGTDLEVMFNFDMVGYTGGAPFNIDLQSGSMELYLQQTIAAANRVTSLNPIHAALGGSSDHASFQAEGFDIVNVIESNFNFPGWHTDLDLTSQMNFPYLTEVVKMALVSVALIAESPSPATVEGIVDIGDGQSLEVHWSGCYPDNSYVIYHGTSPGIYTDSVTVGPGVCSYVWDGLEEGSPDYFLVVGIALNGYRSLYGVEGSETPLVYPRPPVQLVPLPDSGIITIAWLDNTEADLAFYNLYRGVAGVGGQVLYQSNLSDTFFVDTSVASQIPYRYTITAVDADGHESQQSVEMAAYAATFDGGPAIVDAFSEENQYIPTQVNQVAFFDTLMGGAPYGLVVVEGSTDFLSRSDAGRYSSLMWIDDDLSRKTIEYSDATLSWYGGFNVNMLISGFRVLQTWALPPIPSDHMLYEQFMVSDYTYWGTPDFVGAFGQNGWPSVEIDSSRGMDEWTSIPALQPRLGATVIYTYDSFIDWPDFEGEPVGLAYDSPNGKRVVLSFPIYYLTPASSQALMAKVVEYFNDVVAPVIYGDITGDGAVDIGDLSRLIGYLFISFDPPADQNAADMNADCIVDIGDLTYLISYLFLGGPDPLAGCVE